MKIKEGMLVKIINIGYIYEEYVEWLIKNSKNSDDLIYWDCNNDPENIAELKLRRRNEWEDSYSDECYSKNNSKNKDDYYKRKIVYDEINSSPYQVKFIAPNGDSRFSNLAFIRHSLSGKCYIIDVRGLEPYEDIIEPFNFLKRKNSFAPSYYIIKTDEITHTCTCIDVKTLRIIKLYFSDIKNSDYEVVGNEEYSATYENMLSDLRKMKEALDVIEGDENNEI